MRFLRSKYTKMPLTPLGSLQRYPRHLAGFQRGRFAAGKGWEERGRGGQEEKGRGGEHSPTFFHNSATGHNTTTLPSHPKIGHEWMNQDGTKTVIWNAETDKNEQPRLSRLILQNPNTRPPEKYKMQTRAARNIKSSYDGNSVSGFLP